MVMWLSQRESATDRRCQLKAHEDTTSTRAVLEGVSSFRGCCVGLSQPLQQLHRQTPPSSPQPPLQCRCSAQSSSCCRCFGEDTPTPSSTALFKEKSLPPPGLLQVRAPGHLGQAPRLGGLGAQEPAC